MISKVGNVCKVWGKLNMNEVNNVIKADTIQSIAQGASTDQSNANTRKPGFSRKSSVTDYKSCDGNKG